MSSIPAVSPSAPVLLFVQGTEQRRIVIDHTPFTIGRKTDRDLPIPDSRVSREHALIVAEEGRYYIVDQGGRSGVYVNRMRRERHALEPNDRPASVARMTSSAASEARARSTSSRPTGLSP